MSAKISKSQVISLFIMMRMFSECMNFPATVAKYGMQHITVVLVSKIMLFAVYIPLIILSKKYPEENIFTIFKKRAKPLMYIVGVLYCIVIIYRVVVMTVRLEFFLTNTIMQSAETAIVVSMCMVTVAYTVSKGIEASARMGTFLMVFFVVLLSLTLYPLGKEAELVYLYPAFVDTPETLWEDILSELAKNSEVFIFIVISNSIKEKPHTTIFAIVPILMLLIEFMTILCNVVLGPALDLVSFPFFTLASLSDLNVLERLDGIDVFIWTCSAILKTSVYLICIREVLTHMFKERAAKITTNVIILGAGITSYILCNNRHLSIITTYHHTLIEIGVLAMILPIIAYFLERRGENGKKNPKAQDSKKDNGDIAVDNADGAAAVS